MIQKYLYGALVLLIVGLIMLRWAEGPRPLLTHPALSTTHLTFPPTDSTPAPAILRGFDGDAPVGLELLDQRAEVLFDN